MHFKMPAICLNLDQSKILSSGNESKKKGGHGKPWKAYFAV